MTSRLVQRHLLSIVGIFLIPVDVERAARYSGSPFPGASQPLSQQCAEQTDCTARSQDKLAFAPPPLCPPCDVQIWRVGRITGGRSGLEAHHASAVLGVDGRLYFSTTLVNRPVWVAELGSDRVAQAMRVGSGPGEVRYAARIRRGLGDSILVHDAALNRLSVLAPDGRFVRSTPFLPGASDFVQLRDGSFFVAARLATRASSGYPLHLVGADGQWIRSFGVNAGDVRLVQPKDEYRLFRWLALAGDGSVLAVRPGGYVIERWSPTGQLLMERDVAPDWFTPKYERWRERPLEQPPPPYVTDIAEGPDGHVWVLVTRADEKWRLGVRPPRAGSALYDVVSHAAVHDTQIEVFSMQTLERVASLRVDEPLSMFVAPGLVATAEASDSDEPVIEVLRVRTAAAR